MDRHPSLYERDILLWSEEQADALRRLKAGRRDLPNDLDLDNIVEEIESVGRSELHAVESLLRQMLIHLVKAASAPGADAAAHWSGEIRAFQADAQARFTPSMARRIDLDRLWRTAVEIAAYGLRAHGQSPTALPEACPFPLESLLADDFTVEGALAALSGPASPEG